MPDPRSTQNAARLSEDIGDVLSAIRRLIAEDEAYRDGRDSADDQPATIEEDAADFLARRYGGNAGLARRLAGADRAGGAASGRATLLVRDPVADMPGEASDDPWPLGPFANDAAAARPPSRPPQPAPVADLSARAQILRHDGDETEGAEPPRAPLPEARNNLARSISGGLKRGDSAETIAPATVPGLAAEAGLAPPLRLDAARRVAAAPVPVPTPAAGNRIEAAPRGPLGWRSWIRPEAASPRPSANACRAGAEPAGASQAVAATLTVDDEDDFAEAFDWKARMRPEPQVGNPVSTGTKAEDPAVTPPLRHAGQAGRAAGDAGTLVATEPAFHGAPAADRPGFDEVFDALEPARPVPVSVAVTDDVVAAAATLSDQPGAAAPAAGALLSQPAPAGLSAVTVEHDTVTGMSPEDEEQSIRELLREMIREELHGELGERFSRNLRAVIRRQVSAAIEDVLDRL